jgi:3-oxoacyl-[acyl-carrier-protein] synthase II
MKDHRGRPRVAVTGMGVKAPAGCDLDTFWTRLCAADAVAGPIQAFDATNEPVRFACEVRDFDPGAYFGPKEVRRQDRVTQLGFAAAADALEDAGELGVTDPGCAVIIGTGIGGLHTLEENQRLYYDKGPSRVSPFFVPMMMPNATAGVISMRFGWTGPALCIATACAAGTNAIGEGARLIRDGSSDVVIAGGTEFPVTPITLAAFARMTALSTRNDDPTHASRPFDANRDGFVIAEGAAFFILESLERARSRDARIYGEVAGYGRNADAYHITAPSPGGAGAAACMQQALDDAGLAPADIGHVNAHGTSTDLNDLAEAQAIGKVFGDAPPPVTSNKGVLGHMIGGAGDPRRHRAPDRELRTAR